MNEAGHAKDSAQPRRRAIGRARRGLAMALVTLALPASARAQTSPPPAPLPRVHVLATGGTISNTEGERLTGEQLVRAIPRLGEIARVTVEQFSNVASGAFTVDMWRRLASRIRALAAGPDAPRGFVVTHGTDTMEETAYFLSLTVGGCTPVIVTGAMRQATAVGADGPANLLNSVRVVVAPATRGFGTMVLMNDLAIAARDVTKSNTTRVNAFTAPDGAPVAVADPDTIIYERPPLASGAPCTAAAFPDSIGALPRVDIVYTYVDADSVPVEAAVRAGARGIVVAGVGRGGVTPSQGEALQRAVARGVFVVVSNRTGSGSVGTDDGLDSWKPGTGAFISAGDLNPQKARVLLMLALSRTRDARAIAELFRSH